MCQSEMSDSAKREDRHNMASSRRNNKPLMEKRRRARINDCLGQLKGLVLQAMKKDTTQYSKLEKADILEMTVKHLKALQRHQMAAAMATDPFVIEKYRAGFNECAGEVARYLEAVHGVSPDVKANVLNHLAGCMGHIPDMSEGPHGSRVMPGSIHPLQLQMISGNQMNLGMVPVQTGNGYVLMPDLVHSHVMMNTAVNHMQYTSPPLVSSPELSESDLTPSALFCADRHDSSFSGSSGDEQDCFSAKENCLTSKNVKSRRNAFQRDRQSPKIACEAPDSIVIKKEQDETDTCYVQRQPRPGNAAASQNCHQVAQSESMWRPW